MPGMPMRDVIKAIAAGRYLANMQDGWVCDPCIEKAKLRWKCTICDKPHSQAGADEFHRIMKGD